MYTSQHKTFQFDGKTLKAVLADISIPVETKTLFFTKPLQDSPLVRTLPKFQKKHCTDPECDHSCFVGGQAQVES